MSLSAKENVSDGGSSTDHGNTRIQNKGKGKGKAPSSSASTTKRLQPETTFPTLSPLRPSTHYSEKPSKGKNRSFPLEEHTDGNDTRGSSRTNMRPFPMSVELLESIDHSSPTGSLAKRVSDGSDAEHKRASKKLKDSVPSGWLSSKSFQYDTNHLVVVDVGYAKDPSTLCPYCDEQLPPHPTPFLQSLMSKARRKSYPDPRPRNSCGLRAPLAIYISVCQRHRFELLQLPIALERGWPQVINFQNVPKRVMRMKVELEAIILARDDCGDVNGRSVFWREVKKEVKDQGSRTVVGVKGQFASFEKTQPGYYGEQGSVIIHQTLFNLFPPSSFNVSLIAPLTPTEFTQRVLVPETATRLIAQDLDLTIEDAITTLRESAQYGIAMFPDTDTKRTVIDEDDDEMGVADQIVMERARARRRELEEEERIEEEMIEEATCEAKARKEKPSKRVKNTRRAGKEATVAESDGLSSNSEVSTWSQTTKRGPKERQRPVAISQPAQDEQSDAMSVDSSTSKRSRVSVKAAKCSVQAKQSHRPPWTTGFDVAEAIEVVDITTPNSAKHTSLQELTKATRATSSLYPVDGNDECTPRPQRFKSSTVIDIPPSSGQSSDPSVPVHPLHVARNRTQTRWVARNTRALRLVFC
ncbi:RTC4-like domain-containing protein [Scleroderma citrinum]